MKTSLRISFTKEPEDELLLKRIKESYDLLRPFAKLIGPLYIENYASVCAAKGNNAIPVDSLIEFTDGILNGVLVMRKLHGPGGERENEHTSSTVLANADALYQLYQDLINARRAAVNDSYERSF